MTHHDTEHVSIAALFGAAFVLMGGLRATAADCNGNGIPDDVEIAACFADPRCGDCNLNGVPDECDISSGVSADSNADGVPDECAFARQSGNWASDIWALPNGDFPGDLGHVAGLSVTLPMGVSVFLDVSVQIRALHVRQGAELRATQVGVGDLALRPAPGTRLLNEGSILVANDRRIDVSGGDVTIGEGGKYLRDPLLTVRTSANLSAGTLTLLPTFCGETRQLALSSRMTLSTDADLILDGSGIVPCPLGAGQTADAQGGKTPPILSIFPWDSFELAATASADVPSFNTRANVGGSLRLVATASVCIACTGVPGDPLQVVQVGGDLDNRLTRPGFFDWTKGGLFFAAGASHVFEVGGVDVGPTSAGFFIKNPTEPGAAPPNSNFSMGTVRVDGRVRFTNAVPNTAGAGACQEALYVDRLELAAGSTAVADNCRIYYNTLVDAGGIRQTAGCGAFTEVNKVPAASQWGLIVMALLLAVAASAVCRRRIALGQ